jgi:hypothetical protein
MAKRVFSHHALELFEVFAQRVPQLGKNGLQFGCVLCGYSLGTQFTDSLLQGYIERHKAPLAYMYLGPGDSSIPYTPYFKYVTSRDYSICCIGRNRDLRYRCCICIPNSNITVMG